MRGDDGSMTDWNRFRTAAPELADLAQGAFERTGLGYLATLRRDGSPRISGIEPLFHDGLIWMGMMPDSRKALDLRRDPRMALHSANEDKEVTAGDARVSGRAHEQVTDEEIEAARRMFTEMTGQAPPPGPMNVFTVEVSEVVFVRPEDGRLVVRSWTPDRGFQRVERG